MSIVNKELFEKEQMMQQNNKPPTYWWLLVVFLVFMIGISVWAVFIWKG